MTPIEREFLDRVERIPHHGLGLSVDVYTPDLFELVEALERRGLTYGYLEIFKAAPAALALVRRRLPEALLAYHAEGLWVTQPDPERLSPFHAELDEAAEQLRILDSHWLNHECAAKQMGGYVFGTYLPALFTKASAEVTAANIALAQQRLDRTIPARDGRDGDGIAPLFLLETPPLTYVGFGDLGLADFFRLVTDLTPCGVVLDIGHLWTLYRYTGEWRRRPLTSFLAELLDAFPLERVVEVHMAGLALHPSVPSHTRAQDQNGEPPLRPPFWIDAHGAPIPDVLADMLAQVLEHKGLVNLKGVALEVDTKPIPMIVEEFAQAHKRFGPRIAREASRKFDVRSSTLESCLSNLEPRTSNLELRALLAEQYDRYAQIMTGRAAAGVSVPVLGQDASALPLYVEHYLPHEILEWGGAVREMFSETCRSLDRAGIPLDEFVRFWFREPRQTDQAYDFFLLKITRFVEFVREVQPAALETAQREAQALREGYRAACEQVGA